MQANEIYLQLDTLIVSHYYKTTNTKHISLTFLVHLDIINASVSEKEQTSISNSSLPLSDMFRLNTFLFYSIQYHLQYLESFPSSHWISYIISVFAVTQNIVYGHKYLKFLNYFCIDDIFHSDIFMSTGGNFCQFSKKGVWKIRS